MLLPEATRPETKDLVRLLLKSKASSTSSRYLEEIEKFCRWCQSFRVAIAPPFSVSLVLAYLSKVYLISSLYSSVVLGHAALKWFQTLLPVSTLNPLDSAPCQQLLEAAKRSKPPIHKKEPVTPDMIKEIIDKHGSSSASLKDLRIAAICCIGFAGFFRYVDLSLMSPTHLEFFPDYLRIFVPKAKNDVYREGNHLYIQRLNNQFCPVTILERYIKLGEIETTSRDYNLFRQVTFLKSKNVYKLCGKGLSYSRCREIFKDCLKGLGYDEKKYGLHSLRPRQQ